MYLIFSRHRRPQNPAPAQPASPSPPPPRRRRKPQNPWVLPWILQREERGCYRTLLDELITTDIPGYRNFTRMEPAFFYLIEESPPPQEVIHQLQEATGSQLETGSYFETLIHRGKLHFTAIPLEGWKIDHLHVCPQVCKAILKEFQQTGSYFETLIHRGKLHFTAIPQEGWTIYHLQVCPPGHFEGISTRISGVPH